jgi:hypothetical protein
LPANLVPFILSDEPEAEPAGDVRNLNIRLNEIYAIDEDGFRRPRNIRREVMRLERAQQEAETAEEYLSQEPGEALASALEAAQTNYEASVAHQIAQAQYETRQRDLAAAEFARQQNAEEQAQNDAN